LTSIHNVFSWPISTLLLFSQIGKPVLDMPVDKGSHLQDGESPIYKSEKMYQALMGSLTYAAMSMQPNIRYITQFLSQANKNPTQHGML